MQVLQLLIILLRCTLLHQLAANDYSPIKLNNTGKNIRPCAAPNRTIPKYILK